jgi:hypothetical protein
MTAAYQEQHTAVRSAPLGGAWSVIVVLTVALILVVYPPVFGPTSQRPSD